MKCEYHGNIRAGCAIYAREDSHIYLENGITKELITLIIMFQFQAVTKFLWYIEKDVLEKQLWLKND